MKKIVKIYTVITVIFMLLIVEGTFALIVDDNILNVKSKYGSFQPITIEVRYYKDGNTLKTEKYDFKEFRPELIEKKETSEYIQIKYYLNKLVADNTAKLSFLIKIKEYKKKPLLEFILEYNSATSDIHSIILGFTSESTNGSFLLVPGIYEPKINFKGESTDGKYVKLLDEEISYSMRDNFVFVYNKGIEKKIIWIMNKKPYYILSRDSGDKWRYLGPRWNIYQNSKAKKFIFSFTYLDISSQDTIHTIKSKARDLAHEALCTPVIVNYTTRRGYNYVAYEVWYRFEREENDWGIDPFEDSPHNYRGERVNDTSVCAIYLPEGAIAMAGKEGLPAVFNSTGENAIGMYFRDSINGPRGKRDNWFGNESAGGGFYVKKSGLERGDIVKVYYMLPAEPVVESMNVTIPKLPRKMLEAVRGNSSYRLVVLDKEFFTSLQEYTSFARRMLIASLMALIAGILAVVWTGVRVRSR